MPERDDTEDNRQGGVGLLEKKKQELQKPRRYKVLLHNDNFTPVEWVVQLVQQVFRKGRTEAERITMQVHHEGLSVAGIYTHEIAETKCAIVHELARRSDYPLMSSMEPEE